ncbi:MULTISPECIES: ArsA family ATPase [Pyrobaculum]|uniref:Arsenite efflux ATP-binding protein ArsA n=2 Tax=Pyrobaculum arsenaticum TaxID=121277 RepID=A4WJA8_PYRAR|nr:ArsA family ATPase [Pyrobaculum arsenaticum]ABP50475.1 arsenite efflux ATP-binding protein ArsA [Pyrobaculum arsenaticum DSM 13514]NYR14584.1 ArsA family ATPase [Pyrobaculum arsenaticum]
MKQLLSQRVKYLFFGGKGGVGKTVVAAATALYLAEEAGEKTLLASFNPVHSLTSVFQQDLSGGVVKQVAGVKNLWAVEVQYDDIVEKYKVRITNLLKELLKMAELSIDIKPLVDIATTNPAFHEAAAFDKMMDVVLKEGAQYDRVVFDMAAVANAVRLIGLSKLYGAWLQRTIKLRKETLALKEQLSFRKDKVAKELEKDPILLELQDMYNRYMQVRKVLTDPSATRFVFVTIPTVLSISVVQRFVEMVRAYEIPYGGVVVNMVIPSEEAASDTTGFIKSKYDEQARNLELIKTLFGSDILAKVRMFPEEIVGVDRLRQFMKELVHV